MFFYISTFIPMEQIMRMKSWDLRVCIFYIFIAVAWLPSGLGMVLLLVCLPVLQRTEG